MRFVRRTRRSFLESADQVVAIYVTDQRDRSSAQLGVGAFVFCDDPYVERKVDRKPHGT